MVDLLVAGFILVANLKGANIEPVFNADKKPASSLTCPTEEAASNLVNFNDSVKVNKLIYFQSSLMVSDARLSGVKININNGYRTCQQQVELRKVNCETIKAEEIFTKPASECKVPTEIPGESLHNQGLALDLACEDNPNFQESSCYSWMQQNAIKYGFKQHPSEAWHWSASGK